jgi:nitroimidazol reductase NimA-like FMN-containing flavoprotein (pyridoxamine 5'-phosphate oxidase superfamily)
MTVSSRLRRRPVARLMDRASFAYLAVQTAGGPHVTPLLFAATADRVWFGIGRGTVKARALAKRPAVGVVVPGENASVMIRGQATLIDRLPPSGRELARIPFALPAFASRNAFELAAFARDAVRSAAAPSPLTPVSVRLDELELLEGWPAQTVLGWLTPSGPLALPARWDSDTERARVPGDPLRAAGGPRTAPACLCLDESDGLGPLAKRGHLLRGEGQARIRGQNASVVLKTTRTTRWKGFETRTTVARPRPTAAGSPPRGAKLHT